MRILLTRPSEDAEPLASRLRDLGAEPVNEPLLRIEYFDGEALDLNGVQGLLVTSANGLRAFARRETGRDLPVYAVGDASARAAREAGFARIESAAGDVEALARLVKDKLDPTAGALLHVAGSDLAGDLGGRLIEVGFGYRRAVLYRAKTADRLTDATIRALRAGALQGAVFFSPRTAASFAKLVERAELGESLKGLVAFCLSPAVAEKFQGQAWSKIVVAERPDQDSLLTAVARFLGKDNAMDEQKPEPTASPEPAPSPAPEPAAIQPEPTSTHPPRKRMSVWTLAVFLVAMGALAWGAQVWFLPRVLQEKKTSAPTVEAAPPVPKPHLPGTATPNSGDDLARVQGELQAMQARLASLERLLGEIQSGLAASLAHPPSQISTETLAEMERRLAALEKTAAEPSSRAPLILVAVGQLREAALTGRAYAKELDTLKALAEGDGEIAKALTDLMAGAASGLPGVTALRQRFDAIATAIIQAGASEGEGSWLDKTGRRLASLVVIRRTGVEVAGDSPSAMISRAEARLEAGDLAGAVEALKSLGGPAGEAAAGWLAQARQRLAAEKALAGLQARALALLARKG